ncbi:MAG TPA: hypothetical protein VG651_13035 [Stellaceae bacterium]|nr:hypothetical protein [Stellaceae bacterium]
MTVSFSPHAPNSDYLRLDAFQINFHGNRHLDDLLASMECFMGEVAPQVS